jgi:hypothetical protein
MYDTYDEHGQDQEKTGAFILIVCSCLAAVLVIAGLAYAAGASKRHEAALLAANCEPTLFISGLPCTTQQMMLSQYEAIVTPPSKLLNADMTAYTVNEGRHILAAEAALTAEMETEQAFDNSLNAMTFTPQNRARALALITTNASTGVPASAVTLTPQITVIADAVISADQALEKVTGEQAKSTTLAQMRSFNQRVEAASAAVGAEMKLMLKALDTPPTAAQED